jgi:hypothetical protein
MEITLRSGGPSDAQKCGSICYEAFTAIARQHNFPPDFSVPDAAIELLSQLLSRNISIRSWLNSTVESLAVTFSGRMRLLRVSARSPWIRCAERRDR